MNPSLLGHSNNSNDTSTEYSVPPDSMKSSPERTRVRWQTIRLLNTDIPAICEALGLQHGEVIILDSECNQRPDTGEHSIIGLISPASHRLEYGVGTDYVRCIRNGQVTKESLVPYGGKVFSYLKEFMRKHKAEHGDRNLPFWGGLMGYTTYEACLETLDIQSSPNPCDLGFVFIERSIVVSHKKKDLYVQSIVREDDDWISMTVSTLRNMRARAYTKPSPHLSATKSKLPTETTYKSKIRSCHEFLRSGDSYELCLTTQSETWTPK